MIKAPAKRIFAAWTDHRELQRWLAPSAESDARMCGHFRLETTDSDNRRHVVTGKYKEFVPDRRLVMTWVYEGPLLATGAIETQLRIDLSALLPNYTELSLRHEGLSDAGYRRYIHQGAWTDALDKLEVLCTGVVPEHTGKVTDSIDRDILIAAPAERVWSVVIEMGHLGGWTGKADPKPGALVSFRVGDANFLVRFEKVEPPHYLSYRGARPAGEEPRQGNSTLVEYTLTPEGDGTRLRVVESGFASLGWPEEEQARYAQGNMAGWCFELSRLKDSIK